MERTIVYYSEMNIMTWGVNLEFFRRGNLIRKYIEVRVYRVHLQILVWIRLVCFWSGLPCHSPSLCLTCMKLNQKMVSRISP